MTLPRERWTFRDPSGAGICPRCKFPIEVHPLDEFGVDVGRCPDQPPRAYELRGLAPGLTGGLPAEEWVRRIRDEEPA